MEIYHITYITTKYPAFLRRIISQSKNTITNPFDTANIFNSHFSSVAKSSKQLPDCLKHQPYAST